MPTDPVSTAALVVALVALFTTMSQVIAQLFATADGYRRCQDSVMGPWAKLTRRRFRWSEMRYETRYTTPRFGLFKTAVGHITAYPVEDSGTRAIRFHKVLGSLRTRDNHYRLDGSYRSKRATFIGQVSRKYIVSTEQVSWVMFLEALHYNSRFTHRGLGDFQPITPPQQTLELPLSVEDQPYSMYDVTVEERSWDFMPAEVIRPLAVVSVSDIAIIARRLGMNWRQFDLVDSNLRAEGNGFTITSTLVRSVGIVLEIIVDQDLPYKYNCSNDLLDVSVLNELYIPSEIADKLAFGIVSGLPGFGIPDYKLGTLQEIITLLQNEIDPTKVAAKTISEYAPFKLCYILVYARTNSLIFQYPQSTSWLDTRHFGHYRLCLPHDPISQISHCPDTKSERVCYRSHTARGGVCSFSPTPPRFDHRERC